jgi:hypothetical protein
MPSAFVPYGRKRVSVAKCGKGSLLRRVEPCERAIGRVHGRRLLLRWLANRAGKQQKYNPKKRFVNSRSVVCRSVVTATRAT